MRMLQPRDPSMHRHGRLMRIVSRHIVYLCALSIMYVQYVQYVNLAFLRLADVTAGPGCQQHPRTCSAYLERPEQASTLLRGDDWPCEEAPRRDGQQASLDLDPQRVWPLALRFFCLLAVGSLFLAAGLPPPAL